MSGGSARVGAQGKLNFRLRVLARDTGGYHQLETVFARITLADEIVVRVNDRGARHLDCRGAELGPIERNLAWRAAVAFAERCGWPRGFEIEVDKRIPVGGGLGGGSADAGAVLRALNEMAPKPLPLPELMTLALGIGSDVPFLVTTSALALAWGRGERLLRLRAPEVREVMLLVPGFGVSTADAFGWLAAERQGSGEAARSAEIMSPSMLHGWEGLASLCVNDLEGPVRRHHPEIGDALDRLRGGELGPVLLASMTGSGSAVFALPAVAEGATSGDSAWPGWRLIKTAAPANVVQVERAE